MDLTYSQGKLQCTFAQVQINENELDFNLKLTPTDVEGHQVLQTFTLCSLQILTPTSCTDQTVQGCSRCIGDCMTRTTTLRITVSATEDHKQVNMSSITPQSNPKKHETVSDDTKPEIEVTVGDIAHDITISSDFPGNLHSSPQKYDSAKKGTPRPHVCRTCSRYYKNCECAYKCEICGWKFVSQSELDHHKQSHTSARSFACEECNKLFTRKSNMRKHFTLMHTDAKNHQCTVCRKKCFNADALFVHKLKHTKSTQKVKYMCNECNKVSRTKQHFRQHLLTHVRALFKCKECNKGFQKEYALTMHMQLHDQSRTFVCDVCQLRFITQKMLHIHARKVHAQPKFNCTMCNRVLTTARAYAADLSFHAGIKPHKCLHCQKSFATNSGLLKHMLRDHEIGTGEGHCRCEPCDVEFAGRALYKRHIRDVHKPRTSTKFICDTCGKIYCSKHRFEVHVKAHSCTSGRSCKICQKVCISTISLKNHMKVSHKVLETDQRTMSTEVPSLKALACKSDHNQCVDS